MRSKQYFTSIKNNPHEISTDPKKRGTAISLFTGGYNAFKSYSLIPPERYRIQKYENIINLCFILRIY